MGKERICWITPDYFYDTDWAVVEGLMKDFADKYDIKWYVILACNKNTMPNSKFITKTIKLQYRLRDIRNIPIYINLLKEINSFNPSVVYNGFGGTPYFYPLLFNYLDGKKIIFEGHETDPRKQVNNGFVIRKNFNYMIKRVGHVHVFSKHVESAFRKMHPTKECSYIPMLPKNFGKPSKILNFDGKTVFLFFGTIRPNKRLDLLLQAFTALGKCHADKAQLMIYGKFQIEGLEEYKKIIDEHSNIEANFGFIEDDMIPVLFSSANYLVQPYQVVSQSGPTMISYNYNVPIIGSDIDGFTERIKDGNNGFIFKKNDVEDLKRVLEHCIDLPTEEYYSIKQRLSAFVEQEYSYNSVMQRYCKMLDYVIDKNKQK